MAPLLVPLDVAFGLDPKALAQQWFPLLHHPITKNHTYRGFWGTLLITIIPFAVSAFTRKTEPAKRLKGYMGSIGWRTVAFCTHLTL